MTPIVIGALGTVTKGLIQRQEDLEIRGREENIQTSVFLRSARILRKVLDICGDLLLLKPLTNTGVKTSPRTGRVETVQTTALLRSARILRRVLET